MIYDLIVIGAGPGGYVAAIRAAQMGLKVALIEKDQKPGGTCLHRGCIPSKAYLAAAGMIDMSKKAKTLGIHFEPPRIEFERIFQSKEEKVGKLSKGIQDLVKGHGIDWVLGEAVLQDSTHIRVGEQVLETRFMILATGTTPVKPPSFPFDGKSIITTDELFLLRELPKKLVIIGGGVSGCEMACAFQLLGSDVTLVELQPEILIHEERLAVRSLRSSLEKRGVKIRTGISVLGMTPHLEPRPPFTGPETGIVVKLSDESSIVVDTVLVAMGRKPVPDKMGLGAVGIVLEKGFVKVNERMETSVEGIYAVGDLVGTTLLAHGASAEALCAVENIAGQSMSMDYGAIPRVVYTIPELASVGMREEELKSKKIPYRVGRFSYLANGKALCHGEDEGFAMIFSSVPANDAGLGAKLDHNEEKVLGATIFGAHAADLIQEVALMMRNQLPLQALIQTVHSHPSLSEIIHEAAEDVHGMAIHKKGARGLSASPLRDKNGASD